MRRSRTILHVDDDPSILRLVAQKLGAMDYNVISIDDPTKASLQLLDSGARLVLLDIEMPQVDGLTLLDEIKKQDGGIQVIMLTGLVTMSTVLESMQRGAEVCVFKPLNDFESLLTAVKSAFCKIDRWWQSLYELKHRESDSGYEIEAFTANRE